jgi:replicative DNA helicase
MQKTLDDFIKKIEDDINEHKDEVLRCEQLARLREEERKLKDYDGKDAVISSHEIAERIKGKREEYKMHTKLEELDKILDGFRLEQLITLAGATKNGKTAFAMELSSRLKEHNPMWIPFEESAEELIRKFMERGEEPPLFYTPKELTERNIEWVEQRIIESKIKYNTKIIFIDHLHYLVPFRSQRPDLEIGKTMRDLKTLAKRHNVCIVLLCHLKKTQPLEKPSLDDLRDSSFIAQESDTVIMIWRVAKLGESGIEIGNDVILSVQANRRTGHTGNVKMCFSGNHYYEFDWKYKDEHHPSLSPSY